jgi:hypothetical protein
MELHSPTLIYLQAILQRASIAAIKRKPNATAQEIEVERSSWEQGVTQSSDASIKDLVPYLNKYGVDLYLAGHWHYYEVQLATIDPDRYTY